ncbi:hypothetical protein [Bremerella sp. P1]|uniref:hypothetical protein n=1 Tax=Bremerella sp. P1 TaxID=3026424 RepID=UPI0023687553|nr:hypothetical protein [Bremerella sp. P1]WDI42270.1 hypothetical protein PSR63_27845 [Bremerella sp. P1]
MSTASAQPDPSGSFSPENAPQVVVRAGKTYVCSACGTLVEIPADVVGQLVVAVDHSSQDQQDSEPDAREEATSVVPAVDPVASGNTVQTEQRPPATKPKPSRPLRPKRPEQPESNSLTGELIDGLRVPSARQLDRALAWVSFHLKVLDRQGSEINRLRKLLKKRSTSGVPRPSLLGRAEEVPQQQAVGRAGRAKPRHAQADLGVVPDRDHETERGPP